MSSAAFSSIRQAVLRSTPIARQAAYLWGIDLVANGADYGYHLFLGRALLPGDFAAVQTINAALLILITAAGVLQPVVARLVAETRTRPPSQDPVLRARFHFYFRQALLIGAILSILALFARDAIGVGLNVPPGVVSAAAAMGILSLLRPLLGGFLQGAGRFFGFGMLRILQAIGRLGLGALLVGLGLGAAGAVAALPLGAALALVAGFLLLGPEIWRRGRGSNAPAAWRGARLSLHALLAYAAFMSALNADLIWVNRVFSPEVAGGYAAAVLLRRAVSLLPGAVVVILFPRVVQQYATGRRPDSTVAKAVTVVLAITGFAAVGFALFGGALTRLSFGMDYEALAQAWLGWMGLAMVGYGLGTVWMNTFLASRPGPYVALLAVTGVFQMIAYASWHASLAQIVSIFIISGWVLALGGGLLYWFWLRPQLATAPR